MMSLSCGDARSVARPTQRLGGTDFENATIRRACPARRRAQSQPLPARDYRSRVDSHLRPRRACHATPQCDDRTRRGRRSRRRAARTRASEKNRRSSSSAHVGRNARAPMPLPPCSAPAASDAAAATGRRRRPDRSHAAAHPSPAARARDRRQLLPSAHPAASLVRGNQRRPRDFPSPARPARAQCASAHRSEPGSVLRGPATARPQDRSLRGALQLAAVTLEVCASGRTRQSVARGRRAAPSTGASAAASAITTRPCLSFPGSACRRCRGPATA